MTRNHKAHCGDLSHLRTADRSVRIESKTPTENPRPTGGALNGPAGNLALLPDEYGICRKTLSFTSKPKSKGSTEKVFLDAWEQYL